MPILMLPIPFLLLPMPTLCFPMPILLLHIPIPPFQMLILWILITIPFRSDADSADSDADSASADADIPKTGAGHAPLCGLSKYILFMVPFRSATRRYDMNCRCHSTSICHSWDPFFTFRPLSSTFFTKTDAKATPILKTLKHKNVRIPSHRASQKLSRCSFGSKLSFAMSVL